MTCGTILCEDINRNMITVPAEALSFRPSVYGVLIEEGKVLLSRQWDGYDLPGGSMKLTETIDQALEREFFEETGLHVHKGEIISAVSSFFFHPHKKVPYNCILLYYLVQRVGGELSISHLDGQEKTYVKMPEWIDVREAKEKKFYNPVDNANIIGRAVEIFKQSGS